MVRRASLNAGTECWHWTGSRTDENPPSLKAYEDVRFHWHEPLPDADDTAESKDLRGRMGLEKEEVTANPNPICFEPW